MDARVEPWMDELLQLSFESDRMTEKQKRIVKAAIEVFAEKGFAASSTSEIAQRAKVAEGTIFRHYKTKKDLLFKIATPAMIKMLAPFLLREFRGVLKTDYERFDQFLRALIENRIEFLEQNMSLFKILVQELPFHPDLREQFQQIVLQQVMARVDPIVSKFKAAGQIVDLPVATIVRLCVSVVMGYVLARTFIGQQSGSRWNDELEREATIEFIMKGLAPSGRA